MNTASLPLQLGLEDLLGEMRYARRGTDMGRLALLAYCEVRRWARAAGELALAQRTSDLIVQTPHANREAFLAEVDRLIDELEQVHSRITEVPAGLRR